MFLDSDGDVLRQFLHDQPKDVREILKALADNYKATYLGDIYVVGGALRDRYLRHMTQGFLGLRRPFKNLPTSDIDIVVTADVNFDTAYFAKCLRGIGNKWRGGYALGHYETNSSFLTTKAGVYRDNYSEVLGPDSKYNVRVMDLDIARARTETYSKPGAMPKVTRTSDIEEDLRRRDFTINAMALNLVTGELHDPYGGMDDLKNGILTPTYAGSFTDDPTRMLRGLRFGDQFDMIPSDFYKTEMRMGVEHIGAVSQGRANKELARMSEKAKSQILSAGYQFKQPAPEVASS